MINHTIRIILVFVLLLSMERKLFSQNDSQILLIDPDISGTNAGFTETRDFVKLLRSALWSTQLFRDTLSISEFKQEKRHGTLSAYCKNIKKVQYYFTGIIRESISDKSRSNYTIDFFLYDINSPIPIEDEMLNNFSVNPVSPLVSIAKIEKSIRRELEYFSQNGYKFRPLIRVEKFSSSVGLDDITSDFPQWMVKRLMGNKNTNRDYNFQYIGRPEDSPPEDYYIEGTLQLVNRRNILRVHFDITLNSIPKDTTISIVQDYHSSDDPIIKSIFSILSKK